MRRGHPGGTAQGRARSATVRGVSAAHDEEARGAALYNRRGSKDSQLR